METATLEKILIDDTKTEAHAGPVYPKALRDLLAYIGKQGYDKDKSIVYNLCCNAKEGKLKRTYLVVSRIPKGSKTSELIPWTFSHDRVYFIADSLVDVEFIDIKNPRKKKKDSILHVYTDSDYDGDGALFRKVGKPVTVCNDNNPDLAPMIGYFKSPVLAFYNRIIPKDFSGYWIHSSFQNCSSGYKESWGSYKKGKRTGDWSITVGEGIYKGTMVNGDSHGIWTMTDKNGKVTGIRNYDDNKPEFEQS